MGVVGINLLTLTCSILEEAVLVLLTLFVKVP